MFQSPIAFQGFPGEFGGPNLHYSSSAHQQDSNLSTRSHNSSGGGSNDHMRLQPAPPPTQYTGVSVSTVEPPQPIPVSIYRDMRAADSMLAIIVSNHFYVNCVWLSGSHHILNIISFLAA